MKPLIGVPPDVDQEERIYTRTPDEKIIYLWDTYLKAVMDHGGLPVMLPVSSSPSHIRSAADACHGFLLPGGAFDIPPEYYGDEPLPWLGDLKPERSRFEYKLLLEAMRRDMPVLGICGGMQLINVAMGGTLYQDILKEHNGARDHRQRKKRTSTSHRVKVLAGTRLHGIISGGAGDGEFRVGVNSTHHQAVKDVGRGLRVCAVAADGVVEAVESERHGFVLGVEWHPELLYKKHKGHARIFQAFILAAGKSLS